VSEPQVPRGRPYTGRFAPSPTGPLHAGSLVAALASWLDARVHGGRWLVRIEDVDGPRCVAGADRLILDQLQRCGLVPDGEVLWQSRRGDAYRQALDVLIAQGHAYGCACSRRDIEAARAARGVAPERFAELAYPGTCRPEAGGLGGRLPRAWRLHTGPESQPLNWWDRRLGPQQQDVATAVGDFVLLRADGLWAYQLAVVVDDAAQGVTHVVRGEDLADNTARQILLQHALGVPTPAYLHTPLVLAADGHKLSKQNGAAPLALGSDAEVLSELGRAGAVLGLGEIPGTHSPATWLNAALPRWAGIIDSFAPRSQQPP
jgi:glutamyl-Q tRNA(Asp) synthetase